MMLAVLMMGAGKKRGGSEAELIEAKGGSDQVNKRDDAQAGDKKIRIQKTGY